MKQPQTHKLCVCYSLIHSFIELVCGLVKIETQVPTLEIRLRLQTLQTISHPTTTTAEKTFAFNTHAFRQPQLNHKKYDFQTGLH